MPSTPLAILDLSRCPPAAPSPMPCATRIDLARRAEQSGYHRYWFAEHHLNPGVAGTAPAVVIALVAAATSAIRLGSGAVQIGHRTALSVVEEFGLLDALHPGRSTSASVAPGSARPKPPGGSPRRTAATGPTARTADGLLIPPPFSYAQAARLTALRPEQRAAARSRGRSRRTTPNRSPTCWPCCAGTTATPTAWRRTPCPGGRRCAGVAAGQQRRGERPRRRASGPALRGQLPRQPRRPCSTRWTPTGPRSAVGGARPAVRQRLRRRGRRRHRRRRHASSPPLRTVGRSIRSGEGAIPFPTPEQAARCPGPTTTVTSSPTGWTPSSSDHPRTVADRLTAARRHRRRRAARHHDHPRPRRPGPLLRTAGQGVERLTRRVELDVGREA